MVCMKTGRTIEFSSDEVGAICRKICDEHGWRLVGHRFQIYAIDPELV